MTAPTELTARQIEILQVIQNELSARSYPPSVREIADKVGLKSPSTIKHHLDALERGGYLQRIPGLPRALELSPRAKDLLGVDTTPDTSPTIDANSPSSTDSPQAQVVTIELPIADVDEDLGAIPLVGRIAAGAPITAEQHVEDVFQLPTSLTGRGELFMLEVFGDSMMEGGILDGDFVVVRAQAQANDGEIVAAMIDGEATVKVLSHAQGHVWLLPQNQNYSPIAGDEAVILGKVVTVIRSL